MAMAQESPGKCTSASGQYREHTISEARALPHDISSPFSRHAIVSRRAFDIPCDDTSVSALRAFSQCLEGSLKYLFAREAEGSWPSISEISNKKEVVLGNAQ